MKKLIVVAAVAMLLLFGCISQGENTGTNTNNNVNTGQQVSKQQEQKTNQQVGINNVLDLAKSGMMYHCKLIEKSTNLQKVELWAYYDPATKESKISTKMTDSGKTMQAMSISKQEGNKLQTTTYIENSEPSLDCKWIKMTQTIDSDPKEYEEMSLDDYAKGFEVQNIQDYEYAYNCDMQLYSASLFVPEGKSCDFEQMMAGYNK